MGNPKHDQELLREEIKSLKPDYIRLEAYDLIVSLLYYTLERGPLDVSIGPGFIENMIIPLLQEKYGDMAPAVLDSLGLYTREDIGTVIFHLVDGGALKMSKREREFIRTEWSKDRLIYDTDPLRTQREPYGRAPTRRHPHASPLTGQMDREEPGRGG